MQRRHVFDNKNSIILYSQSDHNKAYAPTILALYNNCIITAETRIIDLEHVTLAPGSADTTGEARTNALTPLR